MSIIHSLAHDVKRHSAQSCARLFGVIAHITTKGEKREHIVDRTEYKNKWQKQNVDRVNLIMPKGQKEKIQEYAKARGESLSGFINRAITETMARDKAKKDE